MPGLPDAPDADGAVEDLALRMEKRSNMVERSRGVAPPAPGWVEVAGDNIPLESVGMDSVNEKADGRMTFAMKISS